MSLRRTIAAFALSVPALVAGQNITEILGGSEPPRQPLPVEGGRNNLITGMLDGTTYPQPVADPEASVQILVLPQSDEVMIDLPFRFAVRVIGDPARAAHDVRVRIGATLRRANGSASPAGEVTFTRAVMPQQDNQPRRDCSTQGNDRVCTLGDLPPGGEARVSAELRTTAAAQPGDLVLSVLTRFGATELKSHETVVKLVPRRQLSNVGLTIDLSSDSDVAAMGFDFVHSVRVRNSSTSEDATRVTVEIRQRAITQSDGTFTPLAGDGMEVSVLDQRCALQKGTYRCLLGTLKAGQEVRVPVQVKVLKDLPAQRSGKVETQARVKSAEVDPEPEDNFDKEMTTLVSRQPELAFLSPVKGENGQVRFVEGDYLANGERFGIGARFMHALVEPDTPEIVVRVMVNGAQPLDVALRKPLTGQGPIYRSAPLRLLPPGARADAADKPIRASNGDELRASYQRSSAAARVIGTR